MQRFSLRQAAAALVLTERSSELLKFWRVSDSRRLKAIPKNRLPLKIEVEILNGTDIAGGRVTDAYRPNAVWIAPVMETGQCLLGREDAGDVVASNTAGRCCTVLKAQHAVGAVGRIAEVVEGAATTIDEFALDAAGAAQENPQSALA